ncbi:hypothetical protein CRV24_000739 [Beauveria bassiana]|nr:hypothetical protein CRV24_000739 [Beauveria bassiana]
MVGRWQDGSNAGCSQDRSSSISTPMIQSGKLAVITFLITVLLGSVSECVWPPEPKDFAARREHSPPYPVPTVTRSSASPRGWFRGRLYESDYAANNWAAMQCGCGLTIHIPHRSA